MGDRGTGATTSKKPVWLVGWFWRWCNVSDCRFNTREEDFQLQRVPIIIGADTISGLV